MEDFLSLQYNKLEGIIKFFQLIQCSLQVIFITPDLHELSEAASALKGELAKDLQPVV